jgi:hypothetical protein
MLKFFISVQYNEAIIDGSIKNLPYRPISLEYIPYVAQIGQNYLENLGYNHDYCEFFRQQ